jgi:hypothetical protein
MPLLPTTQYVQTTIKFHYDLFDKVTNHQPLPPIPPSAAPGTITVYYQTQLDYVHKLTLTDIVTPTIILTFDSQFSDSTPHDNISIIEANGVDPINVGKAIDDLFFQIAKVNHRAKSASGRSLQLLPTRVLRTPTIERQFLAALPPNGPHAGSQSQWDGF